MKSWQVTLPNEAATARLGGLLWKLLPRGAVVALNGTLGAGKTRLVQALAAAAGVDPRDCVSPTFVLIHEYQGECPIYHLDAYRLRDDDEFLELGPEEYFNGSGLTLVEWAERVQRCLPEEHLELRLVPTGDISRDATFSAHGAAYEALVDQLCTDWNSTAAVS